MTETLLSRRSLLAAGLAMLGPHAAAQEPPADVTYVQDFDELWRTLDERYCYFTDKATDWQLVRSRFRPLALAATDDAGLTEIVRRVLAELYDPHTHLSDPPDGSPRWPLYDLLAVAEGEHARIAAVEPASAAAQAGLAAGDLVALIDGVPIRQVVRSLLPTCLKHPDPAALRYAVNVAVAGKRGQPRKLEVVDRAGGTRPVSLPVLDRPPLPDIEFRTLPSGFGSIVLRSFARAETAQAFDRALAQLRQAPGLIIDVRENGGGDTAVARPMIGRFIAERRPYARMRRRDGSGLSAPWTEYVDPAGPFTYTNPVVVLTSPWSASMAEGFPMGMRDIGRATIVGTRMMGLGAAVFSLRLDRTGIQAQYSAEPVYDLADRSRSDLRPDIETAFGEDALARGEQELRRLTQG